MGIRIQNLFRTIPYRMLIVFSLFFLSKNMRSQNFFKFEKYLAYLLYGLKTKQKKLCLEKEGFNFCSIEYKGKGIHALMKEVEEERSVCS